MLLHKYVALDSYFDLLSIRMNIYQETRYQLEEESDGNIFWLLSVENVFSWQMFIAEDN